MVSCGVFVIDSVNTSIIKQNLSIMKNVIFVFLFVFINTISFGQIGDFKVATNIKVTQIDTMEVKEFTNYEIEFVGDTIKFDCVKCGIDFSIKIVEKWETEVRKTCTMKHSFSSEGDHVVILYTLDGHPVTVAIKRESGAATYFLFNPEIEKNANL